MDREIAFENKRIYRSPGGDIMRQALPMRDAILFSETRPVKSLRRKYSNCEHDCVTISLSKRATDFKFQTPAGRLPLSNLSRTRNVVYLSYIYTYMSK